MGHNNSRLVIFGLVLVNYGKHKTLLFRDHNQFLHNHLYALMEKGCTHVPI